MTDSPEQRPIRRIGAALCVLTAMSLSSCAGEPTGQPGHTFEIVDQDGVPTAINSAVPRYAGDLFAYEKILEIRPQPGNDESLLYMPSGFTTDGEAYYVADTGNHRIAVFDLEGRYLRSIGRQGEGPGELQFPGAEVPASFTLRDGVISVFVGGRRATARFATDGTLIEEIPTAELSPRGIVVGSEPGGGPIIWELINERTPEHMLTSARIRVFDQESREIAAVASPSLPTAAFQTLADQERPSRVVLNYAAWPDVQLVGDDRILVIPGSQPVLRWYDLMGELTRQVRLEIPLEVTAEDRDRVFQAVDRAIARGGDEAEMWTRQRQRIAFAERKSPWSFARVDDAGYVWLFKPFATIAAAADGSRPFEVMLIDPNGEYLGDTTLPSARATALLGIRILGGRLLMIEEDPTSGEAVPTVYRLVPAADGFEYPR